MPSTPAGTIEAFPGERAGIRARLAIASWRAQLNRLPAGPQLAEWLARRPTELATVSSPARPAIAVGAPPNEDLDDVGQVWPNTLIESMQARQRLISHLQAEQLADVADLSRGYPGLLEQVPAELGMALHLHETDAGRLVDVARRLTSDLIPTWQALHRGAVSQEVATAICSATETSDPEIAGRVQDAVLPRAPHMTARAVRKRCHQLVAKLDPANVRRRHQLAAADRSVTRQLGSDGMASLTLWAPAPAVATVWHALTLLGREARTPDDQRTAGNRRADALTDLCGGILATGGIPGSVAEVGGAADRPDCAGGAGAASPDGAAGRHGSGRRVTRRPTTLINVTVPYPVLFGADLACDVSGFGSITADQARAMMTEDSRLRRLLLDPVTGAVLDVGRTTYRPPKHLADHVRARDVTCVAPGCDIPAMESDVDHRTAFRPGQADGGLTSTANLNTLCRHHHRAKDGGGSSLTLSDSGYVWTTPLGRSYSRVAPTLYEPGDSDGPLSEPSDGRIPAWARRHLGADGSVVNDGALDEGDAEPEADDPPF